MNREVCGICWCPYDDNGACGCKPQTGEGMTTDELIDLAHKAGNPAITRYGLAVVTIKWMESFAALVAAAKDAEHQQTLALQQRSYEREIEIEVEAEREAIIQAMPGGHSVDPQWVCDMIRARSNA